MKPIHLFVGTVVLLFVSFSSAEAGTPCASHEEKIACALSLNDLGNGGESVMIEGSESSICLKEGRSESWGGKGANHVYEVRFFAPERRLHLKISNHEGLYATAGFLIDHENEAIVYLGRKGSGISHSVTCWKAAD